MFDNLTGGNRIPVILVEELQVLPGASMPVKIVDPESVELIHDMLASDIYKFVFAFPPPECGSECSSCSGHPLHEIAHVGVLVKITEVLHDSSKGMVLQILGICRVSLGDRTVESPLMYEFGLVEDECDLSNAEGDFEALRAKYDKVLRNQPNAPEALVQEMRAITDPIQYMYAVMHQIDETPAMMRLYLSEKDLSVNLGRLANALKRYDPEEMEGNPMASGSSGGMNGEIRKELEAKIKAKHMPEEAEQACMKEVDRLGHTRSDASEYGTILDYIDTMIALPWSEKSADKIDLDAAEKILNDDHYGLEDVKKRVLEFLAVVKMSASNKGPILCLVGPPGTGKTSIVKSIARSMGRKYVRISLGGVHDESEIRGHRRTYVGSMPGRFMKAMKEAGTINPVICLDEIDKIGGMSNHGDPASALLEVLDPEQNHQFHDNYLGVKYDLSKVMFVATGNYPENISPPVYDRMEVVDIDGYTMDEKEKIAKGWLIPRNLEPHGLSTETFKIKRDALLRVIEDYTYEAGVRRLEQRIQSLMRRAAFDVAKGKKSVTITTARVEKEFGAAPYKEKLMPEPTVGVVAGLCVTSYGGDLLFVEAKTLPGKGGFTVTGRAGETMLESSDIVKSVVRGLCPDWRHDKCDIHIHFPAGATPKDGPSAGVTMTTALYSVVTKKPVPQDLCMTGEVDLVGRVLPIGGIGRKLMAAFRAGCHRAIVPLANKKDYDEEVVDEVKKGMSVTFVDNVHDLIKNVF